MDTQVVDRFASRIVKLLPRLSLKSYRPTLRRPSETILVVLGTAALFAAALGYILRFSVNAPYVDEWDLTQVILGGMSLREWTFTRLNEHFFIPANAIWYVTMKASGLDFRVGMIVNLLLHLAALIVLMRAARRLRGWTSVSDLVFPAALLHWGHAYNLLMSYQIVFGCFALSAAIMLWVIATAEVGKESRTAKRGAVALLLLMLNGGMGIAFVPSLAIWIAVLSMGAMLTALREYARAANSDMLTQSREHGTRNSILPFALLAGALTYVAFVLLNAPKVSAAPVEAISITRLTWCIIQYFGIGTGLWIDGPHWPRNGITVTSAFTVLVVALIVATCRRRDGGRSAGFMLFVGGHFAVALGIAVSRGGGLAERYVTISAIGIVAALLALISLSDLRVVRLLQIALAILLVVLNFIPGERFGHQHRSLYRSFANDLRAGMPIGFLRDKYQSRLRVGENLEPALERLKEHHIREYEFAVPTPQMNVLPITIAKLEEALNNAPGPVLGLTVEIEVKQATAWSELRLTYGERVAVIYPPRAPGVYRLRFWLNDVVQGAKLSETSQPPVIELRSASWLLK